jgi:hypothetical protein
LLAAVDGDETLVGTKRYIVLFLALKWKSFYEGNPDAAVTLPGPGNPG